MDVHRSRFVEYPASTISVVAFSRSGDEPLPAGQQQAALKLAIGRINGDVEIWDPLGGDWVQETVFLGDNKSIDALVWTREPDETDQDGNPILGQYRLFSITASPAVTEWDLKLGAPKRQSTGNFSEVWCFAAQPRYLPDCTESQSQELIAGCEDGTLVLLSTTDNDLQYKRSLARTTGKKARCMSVAYQRRDRVIAGFADSSIRIYDTRNGSNVRNMSLGASIPGAPRNTLVWKVRCLPNGDIVSADSNGEVKIWDGRSYSLKQRIKAHETDCVELVTSSDGDNFLSGGLDGRLAIYRRSTNPAGRQTWSKGLHRRLHSGDLKSMAAFDSETLSVVASAGDEAAPLIVPLREYGKERHRSLPSLPQDPPVRSARHARLLVSWWDRTISIWRISRQQTASLEPEPQSPKKLVARIDLDTRSKIQSVSISDDGRLIAASTSSEVKLFQLRKRLDHDSLSVRKVHLPKAVSSGGARLVEVAPNGKWLAVVSFDNDVTVVRLTASTANRKQIQVLDSVVDFESRRRKTTPQNGLKSYSETITRLTFAPDCSIIAVSTLSGCIDTWVLVGTEDPTAAPIETENKPAAGSSDEGSDSDSSDDEDATTIFYGQSWIENPAGHLLPRLDSTPLVLSFRPTSKAHKKVKGKPKVPTPDHSRTLPTGQYRLWVITAKHQMYEFDVLAGKLSAWSRQHPTASLPTEFTKLADRVMGAVWDITATWERVWLYGSTWMFMLNLRDTTPERKRKGGADAGDADAHKRQKRLSGAGGKVPAAHRGGGGVPEAARRYEDGLWTEMQLDGPDLRGEVSDDEEDDGELRLRLARFSGSGPAAQRGSGERPERKSWCLFQYRPILGVVPLEEEFSEDEDRPLEVVVVERPQTEKM